MLSERQDLAVHRFNQYCSEKSILLLHGVGSGKTITSLTMALNKFDWGIERENPGEAKKIVIIAPSGIFGNFLEDGENNIPTFKIRDKNKPDGSKYEFYTRCEYQGRPITLCGYKYSTLGTMMGGKPDDPKSLTEQFKNTVVIFDEAHRLFRPIKALSGVTDYETHRTVPSNMMNRMLKIELLKSVKYFIVMTGTPYSLGLKDFFDMVRFIECSNSGNYVSCEYASNFKPTRYAPTMKSWFGNNYSQNGTLNWHILFGMLGVIGNVVPDFVQNPIYSVTSTASRSYQSYKERGYIIERSTHGKKFMNQLKEKLMEKKNQGGGMNIDDAYKILELDKEELMKKENSKSILKKKYYTLSVKYHPDKYKNSGEAFKRIKEAYEIVLENLEGKKSEESEDKIKNILIGILKNIYSEKELNNYLNMMIELFSSEKFIECINANTNGICILYEKFGSEELFPFYFSGVLQDSKEIFSNFDGKMLADDIIKSTEPIEDVLLSTVQYIDTDKIVKNLKHVEEEFKLRIKKSTRVIDNYMEEFPKIKKSFIKNDKKIVSLETLKKNFLQFENFINGIAKEIALALDNIIGLSSNSGTVSSTLNAAKASFYFGVAYENINKIRVATNTVYTVLSKFDTPKNTPLKIKGGLGSIILSNTIRSILVKVYDGIIAAGGSSAEAISEVNSTVAELLKSATTAFADGSITASIKDYLINFLSQSGGYFMLLTEPYFEIIFPYLSASLNAINTGLSFINLPSLNSVYEGILTIPSLTLNELWSSALNLFSSGWAWMSTPTGFIVSIAATYIFRRNIYDYFTRDSVLRTSITQKLKVWSEIHVPYDYDLIATDTLKFVSVIDNDMSKIKNTLTGKKIKLSDIKIGSLTKYILDNKERIAALNTDKKNLKSNLKNLTEKGPETVFNSGMVYEFTYKFDEDKTALENSIKEVDAEIKKYEQWIDQLEEMLRATKKDDPVLEFSGLNKTTLQRVTDNIELLDPKDIILYNYPQKQVLMLYCRYTKEQKKFMLEIYNSVLHTKWWKSDIGDLSDKRNEILRCVGNYSTDFDKCTAVYDFDKSETKKPSIDDLPIYKLESQYFDRTMRSDYDMTTACDDAKFVCPKFLRVVQYLLLMTTGKMFCATSDNNAKIYQPHLIINPEQESAAYNHMNDTKFVESLDDEKSKEATHYFLPLVWSCGSKKEIPGAQLFAYFLTKLGLKYTVIHSDNRNSEVQKLQKEKALKYVYPIFKEEEELLQLLQNRFFADLENTLVNKAQDNAYEAIRAFVHNHRGYFDNNPICVLLHSDMTEGIDCKHNPAIMLLEPPHTYCDYEQLCGRVLRTYSKGYAKRPTKIIYQFACYDIGDIEQIYLKRLDPFKSKEVISAEGLDLFYKPNGDVKDEVYTEIQQSKTFLSNYTPKGTITYLYNLFFRNPFYKSCSMSLKERWTFTLLKFKKYFSFFYTHEENEIIANIIHSIDHHCKKTIEYTPTVLEAIYGDVDNKFAIIQARTISLTETIDTLYAAYERRSEKPDNSFTGPVRQARNVKTGKLETITEIESSRYTKLASINNNVIDVTIKDLTNLTLNIDSSPDFNRIIEIQKEHYKIKQLFKAFSELKTKNDKLGIPDLIAIEKCVDNNPDTDFKESVIKNLPWCDPFIRPRECNKLYSCKTIGEIKSLENIQKSKELEDLELEILGKIKNLETLKNLQQIKKETKDLQEKIKTYKKQTKTLMKGKIKYHKQDMDTVGEWWLKNDRKKGDDSDCGGDDEAGDDDEAAGDDDDDDDHEDDDEDDEKKPPKKSTKRLKVKTETETIPPPEKRVTRAAAAATAVDHADDEKHEQAKAAAKPKKTATELEGKRRETSISVNGLTKRK